MISRDWDRHRYQVLFRKWWDRNYMSTSTLRMRVTASLRPSLLASSINPFPTDQLHIKTSLTPLITIWLCFIGCRFRDSSDVAHFNTGFIDKERDSLSSLRWRSLSEKEKSNYYSHANLPVTLFFLNNITNVIKKCSSFVFKNEATKNK